MSLQSDDLVRGYSVTDHRPAAIARVSFDDRSGAYANAMLAMSYDRDSPAVKASVANIGYAQKVLQRVSLDAGYIHGWYFRFGQAPGQPDVGFDEIYVGAVLGRTAYHTYYSPNYLNTGIGTLYHEIQGAKTLTGNVAVHALLGRITYLEPPTSRHQLPDDYRWALGLSRPFGPVTLDLTLDGGRSSLKRLFGDTHADRSRLVGGVKLVF